MSGEISTVECPLCDGTGEVIRVWLDDKPISCPMCEGDKCVLNDYRLKRLVDAVLYGAEGEA